MNLARRRCATPIPALIAVLWAVSISSANAQSGSSPAPDMPLPPCTFVEGQWHGACPAESEYLSGYGSGRFSPGSSVVVWADPIDPSCDRWVANTGELSPSPCYSRVWATTVVTCATIDLLDGERFRELPCAQALYVDTQDVPNPLFTTRRPSGYEDWNGATTCGAQPSYSVYVYGGPATNESAVWRTRGPLALPCEITFQGLRRPDGLYGPTWAKVRVSVSRTDSGTTIGGSSVWAEFYIPIDGDLRFDSVDVSVEAEGSVTEANWDNGRVLATYTATVSSIGDSDAENVRLVVDFPEYISIKDVSSQQCRISGGLGDYTGGSPLPGTALRAGGNVNCQWPALDTGDAETVTVVARIVNATDLHAFQEGLIPAVHHPGSSGDPSGVVFRASADGDAIESNNEATVAVDIPFRSGSYTQTREAMRLLDQHFAYEGALLGGACNNYKLAILDQLMAIHNVYPHVFDNLSYGGITSGSYRILWSNNTAGHVGVVVYPKGTNYRETGIIINGTPWPSPLNFTSEHGNGTALGGLLSTSMTGSYLLTPADSYPGFPFHEGESMMHFEGRYPHNAGEFVAGGGTPPPPGPDPLDGATCPFAPDAVVVATASPVELLITNPLGQRIETDNGQIIVQELDGMIIAAPFPHDDGTYGWSLALPVDDYDVQLRGIAEGTYELTLVTYDHDGTPMEEVTVGSTWPGQMEQFSVTAPAAPPTAPDPAPPVTPPTTPVQPGTPAPSGRSGGGSALPLWMLFTLAGLTLLRRQRQR